MHGWHGRILQVDLGQGTVWRESLSAEMLACYLGGRGLAGRLMRDYYSLDPFDTRMPLIFACGPLCGTSAPASAQLSIASRSPLTGTFFDCPLTGVFPLQLKAAGLDAVIIRGESRKPVLLSIRPERDELLPADALWGMDIPACCDRLAALGSTALIGPAGENGVLFAGIATSDAPLPGRGGLGAVMGSKRLKAVVAAGDLQTTMADPARFCSGVADVVRLFNASAFLTGPLGVAQFGSSLLVDLTSRRRMTPTRNFRETFFAGAACYSGPALKKRFGCSAPTHGALGDSWRLFTAAGEPLPEYDALSHFGALNGIDDPAVIVNANRACLETGMDPVSAAVTLAAWGEIRGAFVTAAEMPGILRSIVSGSGQGTLLGKGARRMTEEFGAPGVAMCVKSLELPAYDPRGAHGMALGYCTSTRGGCDRQAFAQSHEILRKPVPTDRFSLSGKARIVSISENVNAVADSMAFSRFALLAAGLEEYALLLSAATGTEYTPLVLTADGARICLTERFYNCANGFSGRDDMLPERFFNEPGSSGDGIEIPPIDRRRFEEELQKYYRIRGLNAAGCFDDQCFLEKQP